VCRCTTSSLIPANSVALSLGTNITVPLFDPLVMVVGVRAHRVDRQFGPKDIIIGSIGFGLTSRY
jgi:hypothetical protein